MPEQSFMTPALIVSEKQRQMQKLDRHLQSVNRKKGQDSVLMKALRFTLQAVCMTKVSWP